MGACEGHGWVRGLDCGRYSPLRATGCVCGQSGGPGSWAGCWGKREQVGAGRAWGSLGSTGPSSRSMEGELWGARGACPIHAASQVCAHTPTCSPRKRVHPCLPTQAHTCTHTLPPETPTYAPHGHQHHSQQCTHTNMQKHTCTLAHAGTHTHGPQIAAVPPLYDRALDAESRLSMSQFGTAVQPGEEHWPESPEGPWPCDLAGLRLLCWPGLNPSCSPGSPRTHPAPLCSESPRLSFLPAPWLPSPA